MWSPHEIRKLIAQLSGIALGISGVVLMIQGVQATGRINVSFSILTGEIESGSAGLLLLFFAFLLIAVPALWGPRSSFPGQVIDGSNPEMGEQPRNWRPILGAAGVIALSLLLLFGGEYLTTHYGWKTAQVLVAAGVMFGIMGSLMLIYVVSTYIDSIPSRTTDDKRRDTSGT